MPRKKQEERKGIPFMVHVDRTLWAIAVEHHALQNLDDYERLVQHVIDSGFAQIAAEFRADNPDRFVTR